MNNEVVLEHPLYQQLLEEKEALLHKFEVLQIQFNNIFKLVNGSKQERFIPTENPLQPTLFNIPVAEVAPVPEKHIIERRKPVKKKDVVIAAGKRLPEHLRREIEEILPQEDITGYQRIGEEVSEQLQFKPGEIYIKETHRPKFVKPNGGGIIIADMPDRIKEKSVLATVC